MTGPPTPLQLALFVLVFALFALLGRAVATNLEPAARPAPPVAPTATAAPTPPGTVAWSRVARSVDRT